MTAPDVERLRWMCRQGDVAAFENLVRAIERRNLWPQRTSWITDAIHALMRLNFTQQMSYVHVVELVHELMLGVPVALVAISMRLPYGYQSDFRHDSIEDAYEYCLSYGFPLPHETDEGLVSFFSANKRGIKVCLPSRLASLVMRIAIMEKNALLGRTLAGYHRRSYATCPVFFCCANKSAELAWTFEFIPEKGCNKTPTTRHSACGGPARIERRGCWEWNGTEWRRV